MARHPVHATPTQPSPQTQRQYQQALQRLQTFARTLDSKFEVPLLGTRIGWDGLIGLIPGIGDLAGLALSSYVVVEGIRLRVPKPLLGRMLINILVEFLGGLVPVLGDLFDFYWKANERNVRLLQNHLERQLNPPPQRSANALLLVLLALGILAVFGLLRLATDFF